MEAVVKRDPRGQGELGELSAVIWLKQHGYPVFVPLTGSRDVDLMTVIDDRPLRIQVKTTTQWRNRRWDVTVCTRGGNRSWNGLVKRLDSEQYDFLFVLVGDSRRWLIPSRGIGAGTHIVLGGPKYAEYEIEPDEALVATAPSLH